MVINGDIWIPFSKDDFESEQDTQYSSRVALFSAASRRGTRAANMTPKRLGCSEWKDLARYQLLREGLVRIVVPVQKLNMHDIDYCIQK